MVFLPSFSAVSIANRGVGGMSSGVEKCGVGGVGWGETKTFAWDTHEPAMMPSQWPMTHHSRPQTQWEQTQVPTAQLVPSMGAIVPAETFGRVGKMLFRKAD